MRRRRLVILGVVAVVVWAIVAGVWLARAANDLRAGRDAASRARDHLQPDDVANRTPLPHLRAAGDRFASAHDLAGSVVLAPLRVVPVVGRQLRSVHSLSGTAAQVADAAATAVDRAAGVLSEPAAAGQARIDQVRHIRDVVRVASAAVDKANDLGPRKGLVGPLANARNDLAEDLDKARSTLANARDGSDAALSLVTGPRSYLVLAANNAEMRAGSGMWLQGGVLTARDGHLDLGDMVSLPLEADPPGGAVVPTGDLAARWGFLQPGNEWRSLMASPNFDESAKLAVKMWKAAGRGDVDGVISVDAIGLQAIVAATRPAQVEGRTIEAKDVPEYVLHGQYLQYRDVKDRLGIDNALRQERIGDLARASVAAMNEGDYRPSVLIRSLSDAVLGRHLLAWSPDETEGKGWTAAGMDGELGPDSLLVSLMNTGSNKLDWSLHVAADLVSQRRAEGTDVTVTLTLENPAPPPDEPRYITGPRPGSGFERGQYQAILAVNVPGSARHGRFDGVTSLGVAGSDGKTRVVGFLLSLSAGESRTVVLRFSLPSTADHIIVEPSARVPEIRWRAGSTTWQDRNPRTVNLGHN